ncbi:MAG TPA: CRISPR-associated endonuclease Cas2 [Ruminococcaceae bacterium]|jgi:CRISPR-associated protein Cas2|nr:CRISPR-associated endonuclease Cas2 [Oscillospiraceae bacterium]
MFVLITYDVNTETAAGKKRLRKVAKVCESYGQRVQNSVFECVMNSALCCTVKHRLEQIANPKTDSLRFYYLGDHYKTKVEHFGAKPSFDVEEPLIL